MRLFRRATALSVLLAIAACAPQTPVPTRAEDIGRPTAVSYGTIVSMRPASVQAENQGVSDILVAIGGAGAAEPQAPRGRVVELIIREDFASAPMSVVQADGADFRPGERVTITRGARTRIARGAPPPPAGS